MTTLRTAVITTAQTYGSSARTLRGAAKYLASLDGRHQKNAIRDLLLRNMPAPRVARPQISDEEREIRRAIADPAYRRNWIRRQQREVARLLAETHPDGPTYDTLAQASAIADNIRRVSPRAHVAAVPTSSREYRLSDIMRIHGPIPNVGGAGTLDEQVLINDRLQCWGDSELGDTYSRRCTWRVRSYWVRWGIPVDWTLRLVCGILTAHPVVAEGEAPAECAWPVKSRGYSGAWERAQLTDARTILRTRNAEHRRAALELYGYERALNELAPETTRDEYGALHRVEMRDDEDLVLVDLICASTGRRYLHRVPPQMQTPREALAWMWEVDKYAPTAHA